jgi:chromosome segregation ATPase
MSAGRPTEVTAEKGFDTGLRAQLALQRPADESPGAELFGGLAEALALLDDQSIDPATAQRLRAEFETSFAREQKLLNAVSNLELKPARGDGASNGEPRTTEIALEKRERELARECEEMAEERAMLGHLEAELAQATARADELEKQIKTKVTQLKEADDDRKRLERELRVRDVGIAAGETGRTARERRLEGREQALESKARELLGREEALETHGIELAAQERALALAIDQLAERSENLRDLEIFLDSRREKIDELEASIHIDAERIDTERKLREQHLEQRERAVKEAETCLTQKEQDLEGCVDQLRSDLGECDGDWWAKQLGRSGDKKEPVEKPASGRLRAIN